MPFRDSFFHCYCGAELAVRKARAYRVRQCGQCGGAWIALGDLQTMLQMMAPPHLPTPDVNELLFDSGPSARSCIECGEPMRRSFLEGEELDACAKHGVWFDHPELSAVLHKFGDRED